MRKSLAETGDQIGRMQTTYMTKGANDAKSVGKKDEVWYMRKDGTRRGKVDRERPGMPCRAGASSGRPARATRKRGEPCD